MERDPTGVRRNIAADANIYAAGAADGAAALPAAAAGCRGEQSAQPHNERRAVAQSAE